MEIGGVSGDRKGEKLLSKKKDMRREGNGVTDESPKKEKVLRVAEKRGR